MRFYDSPEDGPDEFAMKTVNDAAPTQVPPIVRLQEQLTASRARVQELDKQLRSHGAALDPGGILMLRLNTLVDLFLSDEDKVRFELAFEKTVEEGLEEALKQVKKAALTQGIRPHSGGAVGPNGLIVP